VSSLAEAKLTDRDLCFVDVETTGPLPGFHEIVEIAAVRTSPTAEDEVGTWQSRLTPLHPERATEFALNLTGYSSTRWEGAERSSREGWLDFAAFVKGSVPVCHNPSFDRAFIVLDAAHQGVTELGIDYHWIGTESLAWPIYRAGALPTLSLDELAVYFGETSEPVPHTALNGARSCRRVYLALMERYAIPIHDATREAFR
jgi:DNA polymerase III alpha subunit (gram-positive type)